MRREDSIALYLRELRGRLGGSWLRRRRIVSEVRAHLLEAAAAEPLAVRDPAEAARSAIARFGSVEQTVHAFAVETERMPAPARARVLVAGASAVLLCAAALSAVLVHALGAHSVRTPRANGSGNQPARQVERLPRQILANVGAARLLARGGVVALTGNRLQLERVLGAGNKRSLRMCDPRLRIHLGTVFGRAPTVRVVLAGGRVITAPVYRMPSDAAPGVGAVLLFPRPPVIEQAKRIQSLAPGGRVLANAPVGTVPRCFAQTEGLPPGVVGPARLLRGLAKRKSAARSRGRPRLVRSASEARS